MIHILKRNKEKWIITRAFIEHETNTNIITNHEVMKERQK